MKRRKVTVTGRVVYDRARHEFKPKDAIRILRVVSRTYNPNFAEWIFSVLDILREALRFGIETNPLFNGSGYIQILLDKVLSLFFQGLLSWQLNLKDYLWRFANWLGVQFK